MEAEAIPHAGAEVPSAASRIDSTAGMEFSVRGAGASFSTSIPPSSVATFEWRPGAGTVHEWLTASGTGSTLSAALQPEPAIRLNGGPSGSGLAITVDPETQAQTMSGFGAAMTDSAATLINASQSRAAIMNALFSSSGARFNTIRVPMGATDLINNKTPYASYDDSTLPDPRLSKFSVRHDTANVIPLLQIAKRLQPHLRLLATPWSAPGWMKVDGSFVPASCSGDPGAGDSLNTLDYGVYAKYFVKFVQAYQHFGLPVGLVSMQNEPENCNTTYPTMTLSELQEEAFSGDLRSALNAAGLKGTGILGFDHNWFDAAGQVDPFPQDLVKGAGKNLSAIGYHCYGQGSSPNPFDVQVQATTTIQIMMTECSGFTTYPNAAQNLVNEVRDDLLGPIEHSTSASLYWSLAQDPNGNPHVGGCSTCRGLITIQGSAKGAWSLSQDYYYWAQFSKFIDPGAVRIASSDLGRGSIETVAFLNPNGSVVLVALNSSPPSVTPPNYAGSIVQWDGDDKSQKTAWLVGPDGHRRWISDTATYSCLKNQGAPGPFVLSADVLDQLPDLTNVWAVCGANNIGVNSILQPAFYLRSSNGSYKLTLTISNLELTDSSGLVTWQTGIGGTELVLESDGNVDLYQGANVVWSSNTGGSGGKWLTLGDDGKLDLTGYGGTLIWSRGGETSG